MFRYGSFYRPLWIGFSVGIPYKLVDIKESDIINGRKPYDVIETWDKISPEKIKNLELTDYEEVAEKRKLYEYAQTKFTGRHLELMHDLIQKKTITTKERIDFYYKKLNK